MGSGGGWLVVLCFFFFLVFGFCIFWGFLSLFFVVFFVFFVFFGGVRVLRGVLGLFLGWFKDGFGGWVLFSMGGFWFRIE